ncbi:tetratricopeptide repeat protein [Limnobacter sp.]|uniref:nuclear transport factor 2 family protein n=1 Tax=Limnobacter sp. TaxID=2003368 RepID=UPI00351284DF
MQANKTKHSSFFSRGKTALLCALLGLAVAGAAPSMANEADEVSRLIQQGQFDQALARADAFLANRPNDAQMRFLKGLILTERNKIGEAITVFTKLTEDYPELPEPYNNLAVLYAGRGEYEKARESLEMAIRTHPSYATAHENLGDVYAKLASQSYDKALQLDARNSTAQTKLSMVRNLIGGQASTQVAAAQPASKPASKPVETKPAAPEPKPPVVAEAPAVAVAAAPTPPVPATPAATPSAPASKPAPAAKPNTIGMDSAVLASVEKWAKAWSDQDMAGYLGSYSQDFNTPGNMSRANWEKMREQRIVGKETIRVVVENPLITITGDTAVVKFKQSYFSNRLNNVSSKTLTMKQEDGTWKITSEQVGG